jgi:putative peptide zinc metalloprotease protein
MTEAAPRPCLVPGTTLLGEYQESGFVEPAYLARRPDGQIVQLSRLLYLVAGAADGVAGCDEIAATVTESYGRRVSAANVAHLVEHRLEPCGLMASDSLDRTETITRTPLLALRFRVPLLPARAVGVIATILRPLFALPVVAGSLAGLVWFDWWLAHHGLSHAIVETITRPALMLLILGGLLLSAVFHELGHATACRASGARPGAIGAGLYLVMPALYTDVTDSYRLDRAGRVRTDLGGVYHNVIAVLVCAGVYAGTGFEPLLVLALLAQLEIIQQFIPFVRLDGYWVISDLVGVPDLFGRIRPIVLAVLPWRRHDRRVTELKRRARVVVTTWVCITVPVLAVNLFLIGRAAPHLAAVAATTARTQALAVEVAFRTRRFVAGALAAAQLLLVALPVLAGVLTATWMSYRSGFTAADWNGRRRRPQHRRRRWRRARLPVALTD